MIKSVFAGIENPFHPLRENDKYLRFEEAIQCAIVAFHRGLKAEQVRELQPIERK